MNSILALSGDLGYLAGVQLPSWPDRTCPLLTYKSQGPPEATKLSMRTRADSDQFAGRVLNKIQEVLTANRDLIVANYLQVGHMNAAY